MTEADDGSRGSVSAKYVIGADGPRSFVREALGIAMSGQGRMGRQIGIYFEADLWVLVRDRPYLLWWVFNAQTCGVLIALDGRRRWTYNFAFDPDKETAADFTVDKCREVLRAAVGVPDFDPCIRSIQPWRMQARLADHFRAGNVFIAGDAAHPLPPTGGQGMNTGIGDVHNLSWKLALVLRGVAAEDLLDSYEVERRPVARFNIEQSVRNAVKMAESGLSGMATPDSVIARMIEGPEAAEAERRIRDVIPSLREHFDYPGQTFGHAYSSRWICDDGTAPPQFSVGTYEATARPGHRAPHVWLKDEDGRRVSSIELVPFGSFALLVAAPGDEWTQSFELIMRSRGLIGCSFSIGRGRAYEDDGSFLESFGLAPGGMVVIRPDGMVAARSRLPDDNPQEFLEAAFNKILGWSRASQGRARRSSGERTEVSRQG